MDDLRGWLMFALVAGQAVALGTWVLRGKVAAAEPVRLNRYEGSGTATEELRKADAKARDVEIAEVNRRYSELRDEIEQLHQKASDMGDTLAKRVGSTDIRIAKMEENIQELYRLAKKRYREGDLP